MTDFNSPIFGNNPLGNTNGPKKVGDPSQQKASQEAVTPEETAAQHPVAQTPENSEKVMSELAWLSRSGEEMFKRERIAKLMKAIPSQKRLNSLFQMVDEVYEEEFHQKPSDSFKEDVVANLLSGRPGVEM